MMPSRKIYSGDYEAKLARVMERLGAESYNYDWTRAACFIEFIYHGQLYRFEHSVEKAKTHGQNIVHVSDLFAQLVMTLEDVPFPVSWTVKMKKKQKETQDILSYHTQAAGCSDKARAKASGGRQPIEECGRTGL